MAKDEPSPHTIAMLVDRIMDHGLGKPGQSADVTQETKHSPSDEFKAFVRQLNDPQNNGPQVLNDARARAIDVDFSDLD